MERGRQGIWQSPQSRHRDFSRASAPWDGRHGCAPWRQLIRSGVLLRLGGKAKLADKAPQSAARPETKGCTGSRPAPRDTWPSPTARPSARRSIVSSPTAQVTQVKPFTRYDTVFVSPTVCFAASTTAKPPTPAKVIICTKRLRCITTPLEILSRERSLFCRRNSRLILPRRLDRRLDRKTACRYTG